MRAKMLVGMLGGLAAMVVVLTTASLILEAEEGTTVSPATSMHLAEKYPSDVGIARDSDVIFADDFESWTDSTPPEGKWDNVSTGGVRRVSIVPGGVAGSGPGRHLLELACWQEGNGSSSAGLSKHLGNYNNANEGVGPGYEEVYVRYYQKFDRGYVPVRNHGSLLGGRDVTRPNSRWVGMADTRDVAAQGYYSSCLQPYGGRGRKPFHWGFYSYHCDKPGRWGDYFEPVKMARIQVGRWHCLEWHLKLNSVEPRKADAVEELWVDGQLSIRKADLRYRKVPQLKITFFSLGTYYHPGLPKKYTAQNPIKVYYDNLVIARQPIGPVHIAPR